MGGVHSAFGTATIEVAARPKTIAVGTLQKGIVALADILIM